MHSPGSPSNASVATIHIHFYPIYYLPPPFSIRHSLFALNVAQADVDGLVAIFSMPPCLHDAMPNRNPSTPIAFVFSSACTLYGFSVRYLYIRCLCLDVGRNGCCRLAGWRNWVRRRTAEDASKPFRKWVLDIEILCHSIWYRRANILT